MDSILKIVTDPGAWFNGIFFGLLTIAIQKIFPHIFPTLRKSARRMRAARARRIWRERRDPLLVTYALGKANANYVVFVLMVVGYIFAILFLLTPPLENSSQPFRVAIAIPVYVLQLAWLISDSYAKDLVMARSRLCRKRSKE